MNNIRQILYICAFALIPLCTFNASAEDFGDSRQEVAEGIVQSPQIKVLSQRIEIEVADDDIHQVSIYALTGQIVKTADVSSGKTTIELPTGYYIVRIDDLAKRVIIR